MSGKYTYQGPLKKKTKTETLPEDIVQGIKEEFPSLVDFIIATSLTRVMSKNSFYRAMREGNCSARVKTVITLAWRNYQEKNGAK